MKTSAPSKEMIRFFSAIDPHTYWTLVVDPTTTTKDVRAMIVDKLGEQQVSCTALTMLLEIEDNTTQQSVQIGEEESILPFSLKLKKKYKKNAKFRFVLHGLDKIERANIENQQPTSLAKKEKKLSKDSKEASKQTGIDSTSTNNHNNHNSNTNNHNNNHDSNTNNHNTNTHNHNTNAHNHNTNANKPERKRSKEGAKIAVVSNHTKTKNHLTLIHVFYNNHIYWTLAIDPTCIVGDVCKILTDKLALAQTRVSLYEVEMENNTDAGSSPSVINEINKGPDQVSSNSNELPQMFKGLLSPNLAINRLEDNILVVEILKRWGKNAKWKFFVKEDPAQKNSGRNNQGEQSSESPVSEVADDKSPISKSNLHKAPILICASEQNHDDIVNSAPIAPPTSMISDEQRKNPINIWIPEVEIKFIKKISSGAFAKVFQGLYKGKYVAVKVLKGSLSEEVIANFKHEFTILSQVKSPHLVTFYGAYIQKKLTMVMEYCPRGTLYDVLKNPDEDISWERVLIFFTQTVKGIQALHNCTPPILHRDLKSLNLLVDDEWVVKVADFGLSRFNTVSNHSSLGRICGTMAYCAPEVYTGERFTVKSDVYSLGIILWELVTRCAHKTYKAPYSEYPFISFDFQIIIQTSQHGLRPTIPIGTPAALSTLIQACWQANPSLRPDAQQVLELLANEHLLQL